MKLRPKVRAAFRSVRVTSRVAGGVPLGSCHIERSREASPNVIATCTYTRVLDYARTDSETSRTDKVVCHIESSGRHSARDASPDVIATCTYTRVLDYARTDSETSRTDKVVCHIERSGRRSARDASPDVIATCSRDLRSLLHLILTNQISKCSN
jgi:hypothetical protein